MAILRILIKSADETYGEFRARHAEIPHPHGVHAEATMVIGDPTGTAGGKPSVWIHGEVDGIPIAFETTWALFHAAAAALRGAFGEPT